jgi:hypothetical protein
MLALTMVLDTTLLNYGEREEVPSLTILVSNLTYAQGAVGSITS